MAGGQRLPYIAETRMFIGRLLFARAAAAFSEPFAISIAPSSAWSRRTDAKEAYPNRLKLRADCPRTAERLERRGMEIVPIAYDEVHPNGGGIHCSTMELLREPA